MKAKLKSYSLITAGCFIYALAFDWFIAPNQFATGGVTGLAQVIHHFYPPLTVGLMTILINIPLFIVGWRKLGGHMLISSLYTTLAGSLAIDLLAVLCPFAPMDLFLACLYGGAVMGVGNGMILSQGATSGGTDIVGKLLKLKWPWLPLGKLVLIPDLIVLVLVAAAFGRIEAALYGGIAMFVASQLTDVVLYGLDNSKVAYIISDHWQEIARVLMERQDRGITVLQGRGAYTGAEKQVLMIAFKQKEIVAIKRQVHELDKGAFLIVCDARDVLGEGFGEYWQDEI